MRTRARGQSLLRGILGLGLIAATLGFSASFAQAALKVEKFVSVTVTPSELDMGETMGTGDHDVPNTLKVHLAANCINAGVVLSATQLTGPNGAVIDPSRIMVKRQGTTLFRALSSPVNVTGAMGPGIVDVILDFRVQTPAMDLAGTYTGTLTFTSAPLP